MASVWTGKGGPRLAVAGACLAAAVAVSGAAGSPAKRLAASQAKADSSAFRFTPPVLTHQDSLFIAASTGEPRFKPLRDAAERELIAGDSLTLDYLLARRLLDQTPRQRHYVENLFKSVSDSGRNHAPVTRLATALSGAADSVQVQLLHIGSELGDTTFLPVARLYLRHDSQEVRKNALRSLGMYPNPKNVPLLLDSLEKTGGLERQARLWALDKHAGLKDWPRLLSILGDSNLYNRQLARRIVARSAGDWVPLERHAPADPEPEQQLEWVLLAMETPGAAAKAYVRKALPALDPGPRKFIESVLPRPARITRPGPAGPVPGPGSTPAPNVPSLERGPAGAGPKGSGPKGSAPAPAH